MAKVKVEPLDAYVADVAMTRKEIGGESVAVTKIKVISNQVRGKGDEKQEKATDITWAMFGEGTENPAKYLAKGSHVNVIGRMERNIYAAKEGGEAWDYRFVAEAIHYLDSKEVADFRRQQKAAKRAGDA